LKDYLLFLISITLVVHGSAVVVEHPITNRKVAGSIPVHVAPRSTRPGDSVFGFVADLLVGIVPGTAKCR
jgi:hypothetical protein